MPEQISAMLLAAGRGERMRPLTDRVPKPLLRAGKRTLIEHHLAALAAAGVASVVVNTAYKGALIRALLGDGRHYGLRLRYSDEGAEPLGTAGGIVRALPLLGERFLVVNADVWTDLPLQGLCRDPLPQVREDLAHLVLVDNPPQHPRGDFALADGRVSNHGAARLTYAGIGVFRAALFDDAHDGVALAPLLRAAADANRLGGQHHAGAWCDVGTPQRLASLREALRERQA